MLCTRMRLEERRVASSQAVPTQRGITQRLCTFRSLLGQCNEVGTPRALNEPKKFGRKTKTQLIVCSIKMQPGTKTLVQNNIKRYPRKLPLYCEQNKKTKKECSAVQRTYSDLIVQGVEILADSNSKKSNLEEECEYIPSELQVQLTNCCQCMREFNIFPGKNLHKRSEPNFDPPNISLINESNIDQKFNKQFNYEEKKIMTPRTRQIIKITMSARKKNTSR